MMKELKSEGYPQDLLLSGFMVSTDFIPVSQYGCFAVINDKMGIDESVLNAELNTSV